MKAHTHPATANAGGDTTHPATSRKSRAKSIPATATAPDGQALPVLDCVPSDESPDREDTTRAGTAVFLSPPEREGKRPGVLARLSIEARILPDCLARQSGRWFLLFQIEKPTGAEAGGTCNTFEVPVGDGCALSFEQAAGLLFAE